MTALRARNLVVEAIADCFQECESGGFANGEASDADWWKEGTPQIHSATASGFSIDYEGHTIKVQFRIVSK